MFWLGTCASGSSGAQGDSTGTRMACRCSQRGRNREGCGSVPSLMVDRAGLQGMELLEQHHRHGERQEGKGEGNNLKTAILRAKGGTRHSLRSVTFHQEHA